jgi:putative membrane protein
VTDRTPPRPFELDPGGIEMVVEALPAPAPDEDERLPPSLPPKRRGWRGRLAAAFGIGLFGTFVFQSIDYVGDLLVTDPLLGWPLAFFLVVVCTSAIGWIGLELRDLRRLSERAHLRRTAERLALSDLHGEADRLLAEVTAELGTRPELASALARYEASVTDALSDSERLRLYEKQVLAPVDRQAYRIVLAGGRDIAILTALSPLGLLDGVLVLWRTTAMLRAVAQLYGMAPGAAATFSLLRRCLRNAMLAGLADILSHAAFEHVGAGLLALLSARAGQGAGNALLASRLGLEAIRQCRPLPFVAEEPPRLSRIRKSLLESLPGLTDEQRKRP